MVEWYAEWVLEQIIRPIWNALQNAVSGTMEVVFSAIFGMNFRELVEQFGENVIQAFLSLFLRYYITWMNNLLHGVLVAVLFVVDIVAAGFNVISGMSKMQVRTSSGWAEQYLIDFLFDSSGVSMAFLGIMILGVILCIMLTLFMVAKSMLDIDNRRPVGKVLVQTGRALLIYLLLPFIVTAGIKLSSLVLVKSAEIMTGGAENVSMGTYIYVSVMQDATRDHVPSEAEMVAEEVMSYLTKGSFALFEMRIKLLFMAADEYASLAGSLIETGDGIPQYATYPELRRIITAARNGERPLRDVIIEEFLSGKGSPSMNALGFGGMPYLNLYYTSQLLKVERVHSAIGIVCALLILVFMLMATWIAVKKLFEIILLYIISPYYVAFIPLDDGELFNKWRDVFITRIGLGFGIVLSTRIFLLLVPVIFSRSVMFTFFPLLDSILRMVLLVALVFSIIKGHSAITKILEASGSGRGGADHEGEATSIGMAAVTAPINKAKQGIKRVASRATSQKQGASGGSRMAMGTPGGGDAQGSGRTFTGTSQNMPFSGKKGGKSDQGTRRSRTEAQSSMNRDGGLSKESEPGKKGYQASDAKNPVETSQQNAGQTAGTPRAGMSRPEAASSSGSKSQGEKKLFTGSQPTAPRSIIPVSPASQRPEEKK